jgi:hypothetical protein
MVTPITAAAAIQPAEPTQSKRDMKRTPAELFQWSKTRERMDKLLRDHYRACTSQELSPQVVALLKKLRNETEAEHVQTVGETKD